VIGRSGEVIENRLSGMRLATSC